MTFWSAGGSSSSQTCWVLGGGQFGRRAIEQLRTIDPACEIVVVDNRQILDLPKEIKVVCADGVAWFTENFTSAARVDAIVPALPIHLAADWLTRRFKSELGYVLPVPIPDAHLHHFPHPLRLSSSRLVTSHADFICPDNCPEPADICTYTKKQRPLSLDRLLATLVIGDFIPLILTSRQFAPGVGGFFPEDLWRLLEKFRAIPGTPALIGTACKCHGIVDGLCYNVE
ncbi:potassium transporter [Desulfopila sp. IMCC35008]|uniref:potassium transporter n=1 Tax=Desulfopila sp. IMCC35008 TaxID=2653858 RepID=UPI0013D28731|nr:potassium transporter [Desulfopila sp. IMCC35008]